MTRAFESRKNRVVSIGGVRVVKTFTDAAAMAREKEILTLLNGRFAPGLLGEGHDFLVLEFVAGELLLDAYLSATETSAAELASELAKSVTELFSVLGGRIPGDENFRNYIVTDGGIIRLDFEETTRGTLEEWSLQLLSFALLYDVPRTVKTSFSEGLCRGLSIDLRSLKPSLDSELDALSRRWQSRKI